MPIFAYILTALAAYLLGSIPTGFLVARVKGIDIRAAGSGNIGATNAMRVLGKPAGIFVLVADAAKGWLACFLGAFIAAHFTSRYYDMRSDADIVAQFKEGVEQFRIIAGIFAILGHNYTCWLKFKGGKGIATSAGVYLALAPLSVGIALGAWIIVFLLGRFVSVASIAAAVALPTAVWFTKDSLFLGIVTTALGLLAIYKHKSNIQRLIRGTESRISFKSKGTAT